MKSLFAPVVDIPIICAIALCILLASCGQSLATAAVTTAAHHVQTDAPAPVGSKAIRSEMDDNRRQIADLTSRNAYLDLADQQAQRDAISRDLVWLALLCLAAVAPCILGFFYAPLPALKRVAAYTGASLIIVCLLALGMREMLPWLRWILAGVFAVAGVAAVTIGAPYLRHLVDIAHNSAHLLPAGAVKTALEAVRLKTKPPKKAA